MGQVHGLSPGVVQASSTHLGLSSPLPRRGWRGAGAHAVSRPIAPSLAPARGGGWGKVGCAGAERIHGRAPWGTGGARSARADVWVQSATPTPSGGARILAALLYSCDGTLPRAAGGCPPSCCRGGRTGSVSECLCGIQGGAPFDGGHCDLASYLRKKRARRSSGFLFSGPTERR